MKRSNEQFQLVREDGMVVLVHEYNTYESDGTKSWYTRCTYYDTPQECIDEMNRRNHDGFSSIGDDKGYLLAGGVVL